METCPHGLTETCSKCHGYSDNSTTPEWEEYLRTKWEGANIVEYKDHMGISLSTPGMNELIKDISKLIKAAEERGRNITLDGYTPREIHQLGIKEGRLDVLDEVKEKLSRYTVKAVEGKSIAELTIKQFMSLFY